MRLTKELKNLSKTEKGFWIFNVCLCLTACLFCVAMSFYYGLVNNWDHRLLPSIFMSFVCLIPIVYELITQRLLPGVMYLVINVYIILSGVIGLVCNTYHTTTWYDVAMHFVMGYAMSFLGLFFLCRSEGNKKLKPMTIICFCFFFALSIEVFWEIFEWLADITLTSYGVIMQGPHADGYDVPLVTDTMEDFACNLIGSLIFFFHIILDRYTRMNLGFTSIMEDFAKKSPYPYRTKKNKIEKAEKPVEIAEENEIK